MIIQFISLFVLAFYLSGCSSLVKTPAPPKIEKFDPFSKTVTINVYLKGYDDASALKAATEKAHDYCQGDSTLIEQKAGPGWGFSTSKKNPEGSLARTTSFKIRGESDESRTYIFKCEK